MAEQPEVERAGRNIPPHVRRGSWWRSADGSRMVVVLSIWNSHLRATGEHEYEISERGVFSPKMVKGRDFWGDIKAGHLKEILQ